MAEYRPRPPTSGHTLFRAVAEKYIPKPALGGSVSKRVAESALQPRDGEAGSEGNDNNRFTGLSYNPRIPRSAD
jgi:hypothetical protein